GLSGGARGGRGCSLRPVQQVAGQHHRQPDGLPGHQQPISWRTSGFSCGGPSPRPGRQRQNRRQPRRCQPSTALGPDQEQVVFPFLVQPPNVEPKQLVPSSKASTTLGTEGNLELLAEEQVVHDEALTAADGGDECVEEEL